MYSISRIDVPDVLLNPYVYIYLVVAFVGAVGNTHTLYVFGKHYEDGLYRVICIWLISFDLATCVIYFPLHILSSSFVHSLNQYACSIIASIEATFYLYSLVRYLALIIMIVFRPRGKLTSKYVNIIFVVLLIVCIVLSTPDAVLVYRKPSCMYGASMYFAYKELSILLISVIGMIAALVLFCLLTRKYKMTPDYQIGQDYRRLTNLKNNEDDVILPIEATQEPDRKQVYGAIIKTNNHTGQYQEESNFDYIENKALIHLTWFSCMLYVISLTWHVVTNHIGFFSYYMYIALRLDLFQYILKPALFLCLDTRFRGFSTRVNSLCNGIAKVLKKVNCCLKETSDFDGE